MGWGASPHILYTVGHVEDSGEEKPGAQGPLFLCDLSVRLSGRSGGRQAGHLMRAKSLAPPCRPPPGHGHTPPKEGGSLCFSFWRQIIIVLQILANTMAKPPQDQEAQAGIRCPGRLGPGCSVLSYKDWALRSEPS